MLLKVSQNLYYQLQFGAGRGTNTRSELLALWGLVFFVKYLGLSTLNIFGDSLAIISWAKGDRCLSSIQLSGWIKRVHALIDWFSAIFFRHIYREFNSEADKLSKLALGVMEGSILVWEFRDGSPCKMYYLSYV